MWGSRVALVVPVAFLGALIALAGGVSAASAYTNVNYCQGIVTPPKTACTDKAPRHHYVFNFAQGTRDGTWYWAKCERMYYYNQHSAIYSRNCNHARQTAGAYDDYCGGCGPPENVIVLLKLAVGNNLGGGLHQRMYGNGPLREPMMRSIKLRYVLAVGSAAAAAGASATAMAQSSDPHPSRHPDETPTPLPLQRSTAAHVDERLVARTKAFARAATPRDALPQRARARLTATASLGVNPDLSRFIRTGPDHESYYYVAGTDSIALVNQAGSGMIDDIEHAFSGDSVGTQDCAGKGDSIRVVGMLPPGAVDPVIRRTDGSTAPVDAVDLVYVAVFPKIQGRLPASVEWTVEGHRSRTSVPVPSDILTGHCVRPGHEP